MDDDVNPEALVADLKGKKKKKKPKVILEEASVGEQLVHLASKVEDIDISEPSVPQAPTQDEDLDALMNDLKTKKKKKPKKKHELPLEDSGPAAGDTVQPSSVDHVPAEDHDQDTTELGDLEQELMGLKKPKSKKDKVVTISDVPLAEPGEPADDDVLAVSAFLTTVDFSLPKKKKRRRPNVTFEGFDIKDIEAADGLAGDALPDDDDIDQAQRQKMPWLGSDRDYTYEELLDRAFKMIMHNNPNMVGGRQKLVMKPPQVIRAGKKTSFANFPDICKTLHREPKHLMAFLMAELGTSGSIDGSNQLIIKGKFMQKQVESVLKKYIKEYVTCHTCRSPDTMLQREIRLTFLQCDSCGSKCSVQNIKSGFQAVTSSRAQMRVKQT